jgi:hypothetical protein
LNELGIKPIFRGGDSIPRIVATPKKKQINNDPIQGYLFDDLERISA